MLSNLLNNQVYHPLFMQFAYFITTRRLFEFSNIATMCNDAWQIRNGTEREKAACMCFRYTVRCYFLVYLAIFMCCRQRLSGLTNSEMLGNFVPVQGFLPRHAKDGCRKTPDRGTPKNCRVITSKHFMKFFTKKYDKKKNKTHTSFMYYRVVFVCFSFHLTFWLQFLKIDDSWFRIPNHSNDIPFQVMT